VKDGDANVAVLFDVGMPNIRDHLELGRSEWIFFGENQVTFEKAAFVQRVRGADDQYFPLEDIVLVDETGAEALHGVLV